MLVIHSVKQVGSAVKEMSQPQSRLCSVCTCAVMWESLSFAGDLEVGRFPEASPKSTRNFGYNEGADNRRAALHKGISPETQIGSHVLSEWNVRPDQAWEATPLRRNVGGSIENHSLKMRR